MLPLSMQLAPDCTSGASPLGRLNDHLHFPVLPRALPRAASGGDDRQLVVVLNQHQDARCTSQAACPCRRRTCSKACAMPPPRCRTSASVGTLALGRARSGARRHARAHGAVAAATATAPARRRLCRCPCAGRRRHGRDALPATRPAAPGSTRWRRDGRRRAAAARRAGGTAFRAAWDADGAEPATAVAPPAAAAERETVGQRRGG